MFCAVLETVKNVAINVMRLNLLKARVIHFDLRGADRFLEVPQISDARVATRRAVMLTESSDSNPSDLNGLDISANDC